MLSAYADHQLAVATLQLGANAAVHINEKSSASLSAYFFPRPLPLPAGFSSAFRFLLGASAEVKARDYSVNQCSSVEAFSTLIQNCHKVSICCPIFVPFRLSPLAKTS